MKIISHRGNLNGKIVERENTEDYIKEALSLGYDVEVDVWKIKGKLFLGHDKPEHVTSIKFLSNDKIWVHAKNVECLDFIRKKDIKCFWHQKDDYTLVSNGMIWVYPGKKLIKNSICVIPEICNYNYKEIVQCYGVCTDFPVTYRDKFNNKEI